MRVWDKVFEMAAVREFDEDGQEHLMLPSFVRHVARIFPLLKASCPAELAADDPLEEVCGWLLRKVNDRDKGTVQSWLTKIQAKSRLESVMTEMDITRRKWFIDLQTLEAGLWLRDVPRRGKGLSNEEMRTALRFRLYLPVCGYVVGSKCTCARKPLLDPMGLHLVSGCNSENKRSEIHNAIVNELSNKLKWMGYVCLTEQRNSFKEKDPDDNGRSDVTIFNPPFGAFRNHMLDVRVACNLEGAQSGKIKAPRAADVEKKLHLAQPAFAEKNRTYLERANSNGYGFTPIIFMSTGGVHEESKKMILQFAKHASGSVVNLPKRTLYMYTMRACSVALQKGLASAIVHRTRSINQRFLSNATRRHRQLHQDG
jgi:hypothetical protein